MGSCLSWLVSLSVPPPPSNMLRPLLLSPLLALASARCPDSWWNFGDSCYHNSGAAMNWNDAHEYCLEIGGYLVEIDAQEEEDWLLGAFAVYDQDYWIGLTDQEEEGEWIWADSGYAPKYTAWAEGEPNNMGEGEDCAVLFDMYNGQQLDRPQWFDAPCDSTDLSDYGFHPLHALCEAKI